MTHGKTVHPSGASARWCVGVWMRRWPGNTRSRAARMGLLASAMLWRARAWMWVCGLAASMRRQGLSGLNTHPRPSRRGGRGPVAHEDHCVRQWDQGALDRVWITDLTYLRCAQGWVYLCAVRDAHSRRVLGYAMGEQHNTRSGHHRARHGRHRAGLRAPQGRILPRPGLANLRELQSRPQRLHHLLEHNKTPSKAQGPDPGRIPRSGPPTSRITATIKCVQVSGRSSPAPGAIGEVERETAAWVHWYNTRRPTSPWAASHHNKKKTNTQRHERKRPQQASTKPRTWQC